MTRSKRKVRISYQKPEDPKVPTVAKVEETVSRSVHHRLILERSAAHALDLLWVKLRMTALYDDRATDLREALSFEPSVGTLWQSVLEKRLRRLASTSVEAKKIAAFAAELVEICLAVRKLVAGFVQDFRAAERDLGKDPPRWMFWSLALAYTAASSPRQREWTEFSALVVASLSPGETLDPSDTSVVRKVSLSSLYGKCAPDPKKDNP